MGSAKYLEYGVSLTAVHPFHTADITRVIAGSDHGANK